MPIPYLPEPGLEPDEILAICVVVSFRSESGVAGTVTGVIHNGTSGKPAAGVDVILIQLQGGMKPVATTKTDAKGQYKFDNPAIGQGAHAHSRRLSRRDVPSAAGSGARLPWTSPSTILPPIPRSSR